MAIKRIHSDLHGVLSLHSCGIYVYANEDDVTFVDAVIEGPVDTPYEGGFFYFKLKFPNDYPLSSPKVQLQTTGGGTVRFNPNLYACGKVCLSILGTWPGPSWTAGLTLSTILLSIQSLMCEYPMKNEPGFDHHHNQQELEAYNTIIRHETLRVAAFGNIKRIMNGISEIPSDLHWGILEGFRKHVASGYYERVCSQNRQHDGQMMADPFGESRGQFSFAGLLKEYFLLADAQSLKPSSSSSTSGQPSQSSAEAAPHIVDLSDSGNAKDDSMNIADEPEVSEGLKCGICYEVLATAGVLECGHTFCYLCAHKWLMKKSLCPSCRETCQLDNLRRIFNLDSLCEAEARRVFGTSDRYSLWTERKNEGIELANGKRLQSKKKPKRGHFFPSYNEDEDEDMDEDDDDYQFPPPGIGMNFPPNQPNFGFGQPNYFKKFGGACHVLGTAPPSGLSEEEMELQEILQMIQAEENREAEDAFTNFNETSTSSSSMTAAAAKNSSTSSSSSSQQQLHELRLKKFSASSSAVAAPAPPAQPSPKLPNPSPSVFVPPPSVVPTEAETTFAKAQKEKQERELERKRLRLEIARDKEERKQHSGVLPRTHEPVLYSKTDTGASTILRAAEIQSTQSNQHRPPTAGNLQNRSDRVEKALETICNHAGQDCTSTYWKEAEAALIVLSKILSNIDEHPEEPKFRSINTSSKVFKEKLARVGGVQIFLFSLGFTKVVSVDSSGVKQTNYTLSEDDRQLIQETRTRLLLAIERFR
jgi:ubiquitin-conjugating enzyme E2 Z